MLLKALASLPKDLRNRFHFTLWGPTPAEPDALSYASELRSLRQSLSLDDCVTLNGPSRSIPDLLAQSDWFVLPSTNEPCSVALLEALCHGIPALVSNSGGNIDIVTPGINGQHFQMDSVDSLAQQLASIANGGVQLHRPEQIRESVQAFSASHVARSYDQLYRSILE